MSETENSPGQGRQTYLMSGLDSTFYLGKQKAPCLSQPPLSSPFSLSVCLSLPPSPHALLSVSRVNSQPPRIGPRNTRPEFGRLQSASKLPR